MRFSFLFLLGAASQVEAKEDPQPEQKKNANEENVRAEARRLSAVEKQQKDDAAAVHKQAEDAKWAAIREAQMLDQEKFRRLTENLSEDEKNKLRKEDVQNKVDNHLRMLSASPKVKTAATKGAWLYSDYRQDTIAEDVVQCAESCETDAQCFHWNYHAENNHCDLKNNQKGYFSNDHNDWVCGHSSRWTGHYEGETAAQAAAKPRPSEATLAGDL